MRLLLSLLVITGLTSCYMPASRNWHSYASQFFGRKDFMDRLMSAGFTIATLPIYLGAVVVDIPFAITEFIIGWTPFKDPILSLQEQQELPLFHRTNDGILWVVDRDPNDYHGLIIQKEKQGLLLASYRAERLDGNEVKITEMSCGEASDGICR